MTADRPRLDLVSPLPPVRSGIADYSLDLLPLLAERADLRVVRLAGQPVDGEVAARWRPIAADRWLEQADDSRLPLYQMGNNPYHREVEKLAMRRPGALTLHDVVLHHYLLGRTVGEDDYPPYERRLTEDHGWIGECAAKPFGWRAFGNAAQFSLPAHRRLVRRQRGVLVHSAWAREMVTEENPDLTVHAVRMGIPPVSEVDDQRGIDFRRAQGIPEDAFLLGSFGFQTPMKRPMAAMEAMTRPGLERVHLLIAGEIAPTLDLKRRMHQLGLAARVHITGFLPFGEFQAAIAASDLALNLRYPSAGETSASLLRVLAMGKAAVISDYAQFAELPDDIGIKIPVGEGEVEALVAAVRELSDDRDRLGRMAERARKFVARAHRIEDAAADIVAACSAIAEAPRPAAREIVVAPPTSIAWHRMPGAISVRGAQTPWAEGERRELELRLTNQSRADWLPLTAGEGGVGLRVALWRGDRDLLAHRPLLPLVCRLVTGESASFRATVRRPVGPARLDVEMVVEGPSLSQPSERPRWSGDI